MTPSERLIRLVTDVAHSARAASKKDGISLQSMHDLCLSAAAETQPDLVDALNSVKGMVAVTMVLSQLPHIVAAEDARGLNWRFIRPS